MELSKKKKAFCGSLIAFMESTLNFEPFKNKISLMALQFLKLLTPKDVVT